jgi:propionyl-CoA synthetase|tara:strand:- start:1470 stop:3380 length:1911 start_codon:yes stop_codon:yes gene_type:complete
VRYASAFDAAVTNPDAFWSEAAKRVAWIKPPVTTRQSRDDGLADWFGGGTLNTCHLALDLHIEQGRGDQLALIYDSPASGERHQWTYSELLVEVARLAGLLAGEGVTLGDRVIIYLPMVPEAVFAMLACARIGAIHSVVFGGFAAKELATRIDDATPKVLLTASCGLEFDQVIPYLPLVDEACQLASHSVSTRVILQRRQLNAVLQPGDLDWQAAIANAEPVGFVEVPSSHPLYILYTSGTTGKPKGVVRDHGGHAVALLQSMAETYGVSAGDVFWAASDVGWVVGHSYIVYAPLMAGCTTVLFEGKPVRTPDAGTFWRVIESHRVNVFFTAPTAFRAIRKEDPAGDLLANYDLSSLRQVFVAGERTDPSTFQWLSALLMRPIIDHWWQTETGWPVAGVPQGYADEVLITEGSAGVVLPGFEVVIVDEHNQPCAANETGAVVLKLPLPPGCLPTVWNNHARLVAAYLEDYPGYYHTGDGGYVDEAGYLFIMGRTDDVINVAGHRLSTGEMEAIVASHPAVAECAVIGVQDPDKGQVPVGLVILKDNSERAFSEIQKDLVQQVRKEIGAFANFKLVMQVDRLPKTRSGKILRKTLRQIADGLAVEAPPTIDDPNILGEIAAGFVIEGIGEIGRQSHE